MQPPRLPPLICAGCWPFVFLGLALAEEPRLTDVHVEKKPGQEAGVASATVAGKTRRLSRSATQAWSVMEGQDALLLIPQKSGVYRLRYYDVDAGKGRNIGDVPFPNPQLLEARKSDGSPAFVLSGPSASSKEPLVLAADTYAVHGRLAGARAEKVEGDALVYTDLSGQRLSVPIAALVGSDMTAVYATHDGAPDTVESVQFLRDGKAVFVEPNGAVRWGSWWTDGQLMNVTLKDGTQYSWPRQSLHPISAVPAGTRLSVRLLQPLSSRTAKPGMTVKAVSISPGFVDGKLLLPQGSEFTGTVTKAHRVGWAVRHETAALTLAFNDVKLPDGRQLRIHGRLFQIENSREKVNEDGTIQGIRSTGTLGHTAESKVASVAQSDPIAYIFATSAATATLGFAEPEILYAAGTELIAEFTAPCITSQTYESRIPALTSSEADRNQLYEFIRKLPFRTTTKGANKPSDITNLVFLGDTAALRRAFRAAGWVYSDELTAEATFQTLKSISGNQVYNEAPMSTLLLDERPPIFTLSKTTNTFSSRHHLRVFDPNLRFKAVKALTSSSTQDIAIAFSRKKKTFIHVIDEYIDNERSKVVNDLEFTGCVEGVDLVPRPWVPLDAYNSTGDRLRTDGAVAVLRLNACENPRTTPTDAPPRPSRFERIGRNTMLTIRNDLWRGNLGYQGISGGIQLHNYLAKDNELAASAGAWRKSDASGTEYEGFGNIPTDRQSTARPVLDESEPRQDTTAPAVDHRWDPPRYEIGMNFGYLHYRAKELEAVGVYFTSPNPGYPDYALGLFDSIDDGWSAGLAVTVNSWRWISNEFGYNHQHGKYRLQALFIPGTIDADISDETNSVGLNTRQFEYNVLVHARPRESRWRPYIAVGPVFQLISLHGAPLKRPAGPFRLGLQSIGLFKAAFDFGRTPPLEGGGIFQFGLQYGGGIKYRVHPRLTLRADFRETWSKAPSVIRDSYTGYDPSDIDISYNTEVFRERAPGRFFQQRYTLGLAFTF